ncbi:MAG: SDR family oxidoreductase [Patescibacteria group bacterium]
MHNINNNSKTVLITGSDSGIGQATAFEFAKHNYNIILTYLSRQEDAIKTKNKCLSLGAGDVLIFQLDLADSQSITSLYNKIIAKYQYIDILINNAGFLTYGELEKISFKDIEHSIAVNLTGLIENTSKLLPIVREVIINIGSIFAYQPKRNFSVYCASKYGVRGFTKTIAQEHSNLKVYLVNPGGVATRMTDFKGDHPSQIAQIIFNTAVGKYKIKSGDDINLEDYKYGKFKRDYLIFIRFVKKIIKFIINK